MSHALIYDVRLSDGERKGKGLVDRGLKQFRTLMLRLKKWRNREGTSLLFFAREGATRC